MSAEFHAVNLCQKLHQLTHVYTPEFQQFLKFWQQDEWKHFSWMSRLYSASFQISEKWLKKKLEGEKADFSDLETFLVDEFTICVLFAYDEILTVLSYIEDRNLYAGVEAKLVDDFNRIIADEANHFRNACDVIKRCHSKRLPDLPGILQRIQDWERSRRAYGNTFLLDRREAQTFQPAMISQGCQLLTRQLNLA